MCLWLCVVVVGIVRFRDRVVQGLFVVCIGFELRLDVIFEELLVEFVNVEVICIKFIEISGLDSIFCMD